MILFMGMRPRNSLTIVMPVKNEEIDLPKNIPILHEFVGDNFKDYKWEIVIADNGPSTDRTSQVGKQLAKKYKEVKYVTISTPGRGNALKKVWLKSNSELLVYMDVDLSSDLEFLPGLVEAIEGGYDVAIGSRLTKGAKVYGRTPMREVMSRGYNFMIKVLFWTGFNDAQCGFKAITRKAALKLLPHIKDGSWFFDSELLIVAEKAGFKIAEIPIIWRDDPRSTVKIAKTATGDLKGLIRLAMTRPWNKLR